MLLTLHTSLLGTATAKSVGSPSFSLYLMKTIPLTLAAGFVAGLFCSTSVATPIAGFIRFSGDASITESSDIVSLSFSNPISITKGTGDYLPLDPASPGTATATFSEIKFNDATNTLLEPVNPNFLFSVDYSGVLYSFTLTSLVTADYSVGDLDVGTLSFLGSGFADITGFDRTYGTFSIGGSSESSYLEFNATAKPSGTAVPDSGSTAAMLGLTFLGAGLMRRKFASA